MSAERSAASVPRRRRVLWLSHHLPWPPKGGLQQRSYHLLRGVSRDHDVKLIAFRQRVHQPESADVERAVLEISKFAEVLHVSELPENRRKGGRLALALRSLLPGEPYTVRWGMSREYRHAVISAIEQFKPHIVHFDTISLAPYLDCIGQATATLNHHNVESDMLHRRASRERRWLHRLYFGQEARRLARFERDVAQRFRLHLVCAELDRDRLVEIVGDVAAEVVPNSVDLDYFQPALPKAAQSNSLIFVGGLSWYPNISAIRSFLRDVWPLLTEQKADVEFRIVGRNPPADVMQAAERDRRIKVLGFVDDIRPLVHDSAVYVCPIYDGGGTKLKMIDAMAMGKAIVAHPVACEGLDLVDGVHVSIAHDPHDFAAKSLMLLGSPLLRAELSRNAREHVCAHFSSAEIGASLSRTYTAVTSMLMSHERLAGRRHWEAAVLTPRDRRAPPPS